MIARRTLIQSAVLARRYASHQKQWRPLVVGLTARNAMPPTMHAPTRSHHHHTPRMELRYFSSSVDTDNNDSDEEEELKSVRILFGSQGGTAQIFSMQLADALDETFPDRPVTILGLHENNKNLSATLDPNSINVILTSVAGVGEPPDNARAFYEWLMSDEANGDDWDAVEYCCFGLGNLKAHPNHFNVIGKSIDARLQELGATRIHELGLGDDGECIEDDFDVWLEQFLKTLSSSSRAAQSNDGSDAGVDEKEDTVVETDSCHVEQEEMPVFSSDKSRLLSTKYPELTLTPPQTDVAREDLFHLQTTPQPFYQSDFEKLSVRDNRLLSVRSAEYGLREMIVDITGEYVAGDHFLMYPKNSYCLVEAYVELFGVDPHVVIEGSADKSSGKPYPHPTGITLFETLLHCVDLGAVPSPAFSRELLGRKDIDYKNVIANPRRTVLDLALESGRQLALEDVLYNMTPMQPRYYSIASSPLVHPSQVYLTYRPVKYISTRGAIREGTCTTYMTNLADASEIVGAVRWNPSFRLPIDPKAPVLLIAGGCGIAPIRAFLEERLSQADTETFGPGHLYLGFRRPSDEVYSEMVKEALDKGVLTDAQVSYTEGCVSPDQHCRLVSDTVRENGKQVWDLFESGGYTYLCGGARTFGAAVERVVTDIIREQGNMNEEDAVSYLRQLIKEGRFCEDLAD